MTLVEANAMTTPDENAKRAYRAGLLEYLDNCDTDCLRDLFEEGPATSRAELIYRAYTLPTRELSDIVHGKGASK